MKSHRRHSRVTDEHLPIDPALLGPPLATAWRRGGAILVDGVLCVFLIVPWTLLCGLAAVSIQTPSLVSALRTHTQASEDEREESWERVVFEVAQLVARRRPELLPAEAHEALDKGDREALGDALDTHSLNFSLGSQERSHYDRSTPPEWAYPATYKTSPPN